jgi:predicted nucleotide-binding protein
VFVVHGRNEAMRRAFFGFLRAVGLQPIEWRRAIELTRKPNPYVGEILDAAFREAVAVIVLLTPDDEAKLKDEFLKPNDQKFEKKLTGQARPNVLFEAGMAMGRNPDSVVLVQVGDIRPFSDIGGRHVVRLSNSAESRQELITKLANAGCNVDASGSDWLKEGDFRVD